MAAQEISWKGGLKRQPTCRKAGGACFQNTASAIVSIGCRTGLSISVSVWTYISTEVLSDDGCFELTFPRRPDCDFMSPSRD